MSLPRSIGHGIRRERNEIVGVLQAALLSLVLADGSRARADDLPTSLSSLDANAGFGRSGGVDTGSAELRDHDLLGSGISVGLSQRKDIDRSATVFDIGHSHVLDSWTSANYSHASFNDGAAQTFTLERPFDVADSRWAAGLLLSGGDQVDPIYNAGEVIGQYRHWQKIAEVHGGVSRRFVDGWSHRYSVGVGYQEDRFAEEPGLALPPSVPEDGTQSGPFLRYEFLQDAAAPEPDATGRAEIFQTSFSAGIQVGKALESLGSTSDTWMYAARIAAGFEPLHDHVVVSSAAFTGQFTDGRPQFQAVSGTLQYDFLQTGRSSFTASLTADAVYHEDISQLLALGGDNGLRGYPLRYQVGQRRVLATIEQRAYADWVVVDLFRIGGAVFFDMGRSWGGELENTANPGWLKDVGFGLRLLRERPAPDNVLQADIAFPLDRTSGLRSVQFLLQSRVSF